MNPVLRRTLLMVWAALAAAVIGAILFAVAGRWDLPMLWAYVGVLGALMVTAMALIDPGLIKERLRSGSRRENRWGLIGLKLVGWGHLIFAALDVGRLHWSDGVPVGLQVAGLVGFGAGYGLALWAMLANRFFSSVIRHQVDRGHYVITTGPYRYVRHPGYTGIIVGVLCSGPALGSWLALVPAGVFVVLILRRTVHEDRFLHEHLDGYAEYAGRVRSRLIPGLW
ncbi:MAG: methyltransferase family protein [Planctomycetota bacterium]|jgi:protein-S-isoprenylcysteine O-methyltransferase Ste14